MIFDDIASEPGKNRHLQAYFSMGWHKQVDIIFLNQSYTNIFKHLVRENANMILIFRQDNLYLWYIFDENNAKKIFYTRIIFNLLFFFFHS